MASNNEQSYSTLEIDGLGSSVRRGPLYYTLSITLKGTLKKEPYSNNEGPYISPVSSSGTRMAYCLIAVLVNWDPAKGEWCLESQGSRRRRSSSSTTTTAHRRALRYTVGGLVSDISSLMLWLGRDGSGRCEWNQCESLNPNTFDPTAQTPTSWADCREVSCRRFVKSSTLNPGLAFRVFGLQGKP